MSLIPGSANGSTPSHTEAECGAHVLLHVHNRVSGQDSPKKWESAVEYPVSDCAAPTNWDAVSFQFLQNMQKMHIELVWPQVTYCLGTFKDLHTV